ncbi:hypothetical protein NHG25_00085 [Aerococcaceae bacterium NML191292]|nr:hypothetical protein [Aerococcaceae bacterium NML191292]
MSLMLLSSVLQIGAENSKEVKELKIQIEAKKEELEVLEMKLEEITGEKYSSKLTKQEVKAMKFHIETEAPLLGVDTDDDVLLTALSLGLGEQYAVGYDDKNKTALLFPYEDETIETALGAVEKGKDDFDYQLLERSLGLLWEAMTEFVTSEHRLAIVNSEFVEDNKTEYMFTDFIVTMKGGEIEYSTYRAVE